MNRTGVFTRLLATVGLILVWVPFLVPVVFSAFVAFARGVVRIDYLMPAELSPIGFVGGGLLLWAAVRVRSRRALIGGSLGIALLLLVGGQWLAVLTGLASGETEPDGLAWSLVVGSLIAFALAMLAAAVAGTLLVRDLFRHGSGGGGAAVERL